MSDPSTPRQHAILLIGPTGSGKSSFVKSLTKGPVEIVHGDNPATPKCEAYDVDGEDYGGPTKFTIIDTPGFEDSPDANLKTIRKIAKILDKMHPQFEICGAIYFHRITDKKFAGAAQNSLAISKNICGRDFFPHVAVMTTMWDTIEPNKYEEYERMNRQLERLGGYLRLSETGPAIFKRPCNDKKSCREVLEHFALLARTKEPPQLLLAKESRRMGLSSNGIRKTTAGKEIMEKIGAGNPCTIF